MDHYDSLEGIDSAIPDGTMINAEFARATTLRAVPKPLPVVKEDVRDELEGYLTVDVYETASAIVVQSALAGIDPDDLDITATSDSVSIRGERVREKEAGERYIHEECYWGKFYRSITLPQEVDPETASVHFKNGILTIRLPKVEKNRLRKLKVRKSE